MDAQRRPRRHRAARVVEQEHAAAVVPELKHRRNVRHVFDHNMLRAGAAGTHVPKLKHSFIKAHARARGGTAHAQGVARAGGCADDKAVEALGARGAGRELHSQKSVLPGLQHTSGQWGEGTGLNVAGGLSQQQVAARSCYGVQ